MLPQGNKCLLLGITNSPISSEILTGGKYQFCAHTKGAKVVAGDSVLNMFQNMLGMPDEAIGLRCTL